MRPALDKCSKCGGRVPIVTLIGNFTLGAVKCVVGIVSGSVGLSVDGVKSLCDGIGSLFVLASLSISQKPKDSGHPYGHGKVEFLASVVMYSVLIGVGFLFLFESSAVLYIGWKRTPTILAFLLALISIAANYVMYGLSHCAGKKLNSPALRANSYDNLSDALASIPVALGVLFTRLGYYFADPLAGVLVSIMIIFSASKAWWQSFSHLLDRAAPAVTRRRIHAEVLAVEGVLGTKRLRTRVVGQNLWIDLEILVAPRCTVAEAKKVADTVRGNLLRRARHVEEVVVCCSAA